MWKFFEGDLEGAGYPRNEKARQGEVLVVGCFQFLTASSGQEKHKESSWCKLQPLRHTEERGGREEGSSLQSRSSWMLSARGAVSEA